MEKFLFENQGVYSYLVYEIQEGDEVDSLSLGMITNNKIYGLAQTIYTQLDDKRYIKYNISTKVPADQFFIGSVNRKRLLGVFSSIANALISAEDYMIDTNSLLVDMKYIYVDVTTCEAVLICLPILGAVSEPVDLGMFFKNVMFTTQFDQTENCDYVGQVLNYLNGTTSFSVVDFKKVVDGLLDASVNGQPSPAQQLTQVQPSQPMQTPPARPVQPGAQPSIPQPVAQPSIPQPGVQPSIPQPVAQPSIPQPVAQPSIPQNAQPPKQKGKKRPVSQPASPQGKKEEKELSMFQLLMHYSKENKELYKEQKARKKEKKGNQKNTPANAANHEQFRVPGSPVPFEMPKQQPVHGQPGSVQRLKEPQMPPQASSIPVQQQQMPSAPVQQQQMPSAPVQQQQIVQQPANFGETTVLNGGAAIGETTVLDFAEVKQEVNPYLIRVKNNEKILIDKPVFRIGKEKSYVDYFVADNTAISRSHANIILREGSYFIVDTNSTNHTYVNGQMIQSNMEVKLENNATVKLANEEFQFRIF